MNFATISYRIFSGMKMEMGVTRKMLGFLVFLSHTHVCVKYRAWCGWLGPREPKRDGCSTGRNESRLRRAECNSRRRERIQLENHTCTGTVPYCRYPTVQHFHSQAKCCCGWVVTTVVCSTLQHFTVHAEAARVSVARDPFKKILANLERCARYTQQNCLPPIPDLVL